MQEQLSQRKQTWQRRSSKALYFSYYLIPSGGWKIHDFYLQERPEQGSLRVNAFNQNRLIKIIPFGVEFKGNTMEKCKVSWERG